MLVKLILPVVVLLSNTVEASPSLKCKVSAQCRQLAEAVVYEARGESRKGKLGVAWVVANRAKKDNTTIRAVIMKPGQFSYRKDKHLQETPLAEDWKEAYDVAIDVLAGKSKSPVGDSTFYHSKKVRPWWVKQMKLVAVIDNHKFYVPREKK